MNKRRMILIVIAQGTRAHADKADPQQFYAAVIEQICTRRCHHQAEGYYGRHKRDGNAAEAECTPT